LDRFGRGSTLWTAGPVTDEAQVRVTADCGSQPSDVAAFSIVRGGNAFYVNVPGDGDLTDNEYTTAPGDNANDGKSPGSPMASLIAVLSTYEFQPGDVIYIDTGHYDVLQNITLRHGHSGVTIQGPTGEAHAAVLDRGNTALGSYLFDLIDADGVTLDHLHLVGADTGVHANWGSDSDGLTVSQCEFAENPYYGIYLNTSNDGASIVGNLVHDTGYRSPYQSGPDWIYYGGIFIFGVLSRMCG